MCDNFSDVAESFPELIRPRVLYRSADPRFSDLTSIGNPRTIINLRMEPDNQVFQGCTYIHCPIANKIEKYDTTQEEVRKWLAVTFQQIALAEVPILLHCRAGKDRTGIVVAILLKILLEHQSADAMEDRIIADYMKSKGRDEHLIAMALHGVQQRISKKEPNWLRSYFRKENVFPMELREKLLLYK